MTSTSNDLKENEKEKGPVQLFFHTPSTIKDCSLGICELFQKAIPPDQLKNYQINVDGRRPPGTNFPSQFHFHEHDDIIWKIKNNMKNHVSVYFFPKNIFIEKGHTFPYLEKIERELECQSALKHKVVFSTENTMDEKSVGHIHRICGSYAKHVPVYDGYEEAFMHAPLLYNGEEQMLSGNFDAMRFKTFVNILFSNQLSSK